MPLVTESNTGGDLVAWIDGSEMGTGYPQCSTNVQIHDIISPLACQYTIDQLTILPQTGSPSNGGILLDYSYPACEGLGETRGVAIGFKNPETGQYLYNGFNRNGEDPTEFHFDYLPAGTYVVDFYYSWGLCLAQDAVTITIPYEPVPVVGDLNGDGHVDQADLDMMHSHYGCIVAENADCSVFELDDNGAIGSGDRLLFIADFVGD